MCNLQINAESSVFIQFLQMALWSCINQLKAGSPEEEISLPWVHLAFQHFRVRLQNFSRIFTIYPPILDSLTAAVTDLAGCEMVWPLWSLAPSVSWEGELTGHAPKGRLLHGAHVSAQLRDVNKCFLYSKTMKMSFRVWNMRTRRANSRGPRT